MRMKRTIEEIRGIAGRYDSLNDFRKADFNAYVYARRHGWLKELDLRKRADTGHYTPDVCRDIARGCKTRSEFHRKNKTAYRYSLKNGWIKHFTWLKDTPVRRPRGYWTLERTKRAMSECCSYSELMVRYGDGLRKAAKRYGIYRFDR